MKDALALIAIVVIGGSLIHSLHTGKIYNRTWVFFDRGEDPLMFWICWSFVALIFVGFVYANVT